MLNSLLAFERVLDVMLIQTHVSNGSIVVVGTSPKLSIINLVIDNDDLHSFGTLIKKFGRRIGNTGECFISYTKLHADPPFFELSICGFKYDFEIRENAQDRNDLFRFRGYLQEFETEFGKNIDIVNANIAKNGVLMLNFDLKPKKGHAAYDFIAK